MHALRHRPVARRLEDIYVTAALRLSCRQVTPQDVDCKPIEADDLGKTVDDAGNIVECVSEFFSRRHVGLTEPRKVRRDDMKSVGKVWRPRKSG
jgi:hypothetical protein